MPRAGDAKGVARGSNDLYSPLRGMLDFSNPMGMIADTAKTVGGQLKQQFDSALDGVVAFIKQETGIDLTGFATFIEGLTNDIGFDITQLAAIFQGIDVTQPASIITWLETAPLDAANLLSGIIPGQVIPLLDASQIGTGQFPMTMVAGLEDALATAGATFDELVAAWVPGYAGGTQQDLQNIEYNVAQMLGEPDLLAAVFDPVGAANNMVANVLGPTGLLALLTDGLVQAGVIPPLDASILNTGVLLPALIPSLTSAWGGTIASGLLSGVLGQGLIPSLTSGWAGTVASGLLSGIVPAGLMPNFDASHIISGQFLPALIPNLTSGWGGTIASSLLSGVLGQGLIPSLTSGWGGTVASGLLAGVLPTALIPNLDASIVNTGQFVQGLIPNLTSGWGGTIDNAVVTGVQSLGSMGASLQSLGDRMGQALGLAGSNLAFPDVGNAMQALRAQSNATTTNANANTQLLANRSVTVAGIAGIDRTAAASFNIFDPALTTTPLLNVTQGNSVAAYIDITDVAAKKAMWWYGGGTTNITALYVNVYRVTGTGADWTPVWSSANIIGAVTNTVTWNSTNIAPASYINATQGDTYVAELLVYGTGTYQLVGVGSSWLTQHPTVKPSGRGATRSTYATVTYDSVGTGAEVHSQTTATTIAQWSHTGTAGGDAFAVVGAGFGAGTGVQPTISVTYGGQPMVQVGGYVPLYQGQYGAAALFRLKNAPGGPQTVRATGNVSSGTLPNIAGNSVIYMGVDPNATLSLVSASGNTAGLSITATGVTKGILLAGFLSNAPAGGTYGTTTGTSRWRDTLTATGILGQILDSNTVGNFTFTGTSSGGADTAGVFAVALPPAPVPSPTTVANPNTGVGGAATSQNVPYFSLTGAAGPTHIAPQRANFSSSGTWQVPTTGTAGDLIELAGIGAGGSGAAPAAYLPYYGGGPGTWNLQTLTVGTDINPGATITVSVAAGTPGIGSLGGQGGNWGGNTVFSWTDPLGNPRSLSCAGGIGGQGSGGSGFTAGGTAGVGPGNYTPGTAAGQSYAGGGNQTAYSQPGLYPGGGSAAGGAYTASSNGAGGFAACTYYR